MQRLRPARLRCRATDCFEHLANYFEEVAKAGGEPKLAANWILSELIFLLKEANKEIHDIPVSRDNLAELSP